MLWGGNTSPLIYFAGIKCTYSGSMLTDPAWFSWRFKSYPPEFYGTSWQDSLMQSEMFAADDVNARLRVGDRLPTTFLALHHLA